MKKILILLVIFVTIAIISTLVLFSLQKKEEQVAPAPTDDISQSATYSASINEDAYQQVNFPDPVALSASTPDEYGNTVFAEEDRLYSIQYFTQDKTFNVTLLSVKLLDARVAAEKKLMEKLAISKEDLCKIKVYVGVPFNVNSELAGGNLGISSCVGSVDLAPYQNNQSVQDAAQ
jgi:hypothetical protein